MRLEKIATRRPEQENASVSSTRSDRSVPSARRAKRKAVHLDSPLQRTESSKRSKDSTSLGPHDSSQDTDFPDLTILTKTSSQALYERAILLKSSQELLTLDQELSSGRLNNQTCKRKRLQDVLRWKLLRGKYRPNLPVLLAQNSDDVVDEVISESLEQLDTSQATSTEDFWKSGCLVTLCKLKGIGPATASAFLSFEAPGLVPFFSDEAASYFERSLGPIKYTMPFYLKLVKGMVSQLESINQQLQDGWDLKKLERALWTLSVLKKKMDSDQFNQILFSQETP